MKRDEACACCHPSDWRWRLLNAADEALGHRWYRLCHVVALWGE